MDQSLLRFSAAAASDAAPGASMDDFFNWEIALNDILEIYL